MRKVTKQLLTATSFFSLFFLHSSAFAQGRVIPPPPPASGGIIDESDYTRAFSSITGQNMHWDCNKKTWIDSKTGKSIPGGFEGRRGSDGEVIPPPPPASGGIIDESDYTRAFSSITGQNMHWASDQKTWIDSKTGKPVPGGFKGRRLKDDCPPPTVTKKDTITKTAYKDFPKKDIFIGFSLIREDNGSNGFNTYGGELAYTRNLCQRGGITGDVGVNFGSYGMVDYTKINILAGGTYYPIKSAVPACDFSFSVHALAGLSNIKSSYGSGSYSSSASNSYFTMDVGSGFNYYFGEKIGLGLRAGYMPVFGKGNTSNNFRIALGVDFR